VRDWKGTKRNSQQWRDHKTRKKQALKKEKRGELKIKMRRGPAIYWEGRWGKLGNPAFRSRKEQHGVDSGQLLDCEVKKRHVKAIGQQVTTLLYGKGLEASFHRTRDPAQPDAS